MGDPGLTRAALLRAARGPDSGLWLLSDPRRLPDPRPYLPALPRGTSVVLRGAAPEVVAGVARLCARHGLRLLIAGDAALALGWGAGLHWPDRPVEAGLLRLLAARRGGRPAPLSCAAHGRAGLIRARRIGARALLSPAFVTASHPGAAALGPLRWGALARRGGGAVALGGVTGRSARRLPGFWLRGLAGIGWGAVSGGPQCLKEVAFRLRRALPAARS
jgi:thiamine-phosphate pyrophosphorylase